VGLTEDAARERGYDVAAASYPAAALAKPYYLAAERGLAKLVYDRGTRRLLGLHVAARGAGELVQGFALAVRLGATVDDVAEALYVFPSYGEAVHYAAEAAAAAG
jgi:pyruvate/2-oxoglutarate dehydrogenase complex dihydrolipoamide dehydrogenase (E3) component